MIAALVLCLILSLFVANQVALNNEPLLLAIPGGRERSDRERHLELSDKIAALEVEASVPEPILDAPVVLHQPPITDERLKEIVYGVRSYSDCITGVTAAEVTEMAVALLLQRGIVARVKP